MKKKANKDDDCKLLPTPKETYDSNLSAVTSRISSFQIPTLILGTKVLKYCAMPKPDFSCKQNMFFF